MLAYLALSVDVVPDFVPAIGSSDEAGLGWWSLDAPLRGAADIVEALARHADGLVKRRSAHGTEDGLELAEAARAGVAQRAQHPAGALGAAAAAAGPGELRADPAAAADDADPRRA